jgi:hypothetical protein
MSSLFRLADACRCLFFVGLLSTTPHFVVGLVTRTKNAPKPFTKQAILPPLDKIPTASGDNPPPATLRDYSLPLPIVYTNDLASAEKWVNENLGSSPVAKPLILGWDMESTPYLPWIEHRYTEDSYFGPATLQLSTADSALVVQIAEDGFGPIHEGGLPKFLRDLLTDPGVIPAGVGIDDDLIELYRWCLEHGDDCAGPTWAVPENPILNRFDIGGIGLSKKGRTIGLARLVAGVLGVVLPKSKKLARTHWSRKPPLSKEEVAYAARDAWAAAAVVERLGDLDPSRFGPSSVLQTLDVQATSDEDRPLRNIRHITNRQLLRKATKDEWKELRDPLDADGNEKPPWTEEQRERHDVLVEEIKDLAPTPPTGYEITESLGLEIR